MSTTPKRYSKKPAAPYFSDIQLFRRVDKYLEGKDNDIIQDAINKEAMVSHLRNMYKEYSRRNRSAFRATALKAFDIIKRTIMEAKSYENEYETGLRPFEDDDDTELIDTMSSTPNSTQNHGYMNSIQAMVNRSGQAKGSRSDAQELINISSDEDEPKKSRHVSPDKFDDDSKSVDRSASGCKHSMPPTKKRKSYMSMHLQPMKKRREIIPDIIPDLNYQDFGGYPKVLETVNNLVLHFYQYEIFSVLGVSPPRGFLLHGPPGCGKTYLSQCIAGELSLPLISVAGPELVGGMSGESEQRIRDLFARARDQVPCVLFIDEIDAICQSRENAKKEMEKRIVSQLIASFDELNECDEGNELIVIGATNRLEVIDPALRRAGRFDKEVCLGIPGRDAREGILQVLCSKVKFSQEISIPKIAELTPGYVAADLKALIREAAVITVRRFMSNIPMKKTLPVNGVNNLEETKAKDEETKKDSKDGEENTSSSKKASSKEQSPEDDICEIIEEIPGSDCPQPRFYNRLRMVKSLLSQDLEDLCIGMDDITAAIKTVQPSAKREGFATVPDVTWDDIGSLQDIRNELKMSIMMPVKYPTEFSKMGIETPSGILLCGPPGCGKTLLAKAVANEANINFISVKGPELLNMYVGESERAVRQCFQRAKNSQPCVIFFDEIDALCPKRSDSTEGSVSSRMVNQVLTEMDGVEGREGVFLMAATNRPDMVDPAVLRPGRFDKILYVGLPLGVDRVEILKAITKNGTKPPLSNDVSLEEIGSSGSCEGYSGADLAALVKEASLLALTEYINVLEGPQEEMVPVEAEELIVHAKHFTKAISKIRPSVTPKDQKRYESLKILYGQPGRSVDPDTEMDIEN
ncbi:nuclear valosin-containing protein-like [Cimex lectularius]|uniref:AAA+ ATPase domain-containing protein n=1 Tax=Cimex lectularius TaxID=79782 RepID=A0A8I6SRH7_CIMLE|nr:nuclear valosin-containing protein-like [Cimex lectularius]XP_024086047.1 nuclear valosin-containing protein-like [Cimex lectularius]